MTTVTLSLISHTNVGKTTLARTLLRRDVGEVFDQAHVTEVSEAYPMLTAGEDRLLLWDTPGLGDTLRLVKRLRQEENPIGWFLHHVWDRTVDRPLWCSQEALRNVRDDADVVLYLVNASESPTDAGYVPLELEVLSWIGRPTLVVLNQTGRTGAAADRLAEEWRAHLAPVEVVREVLPLDAFARSWVQEDELLERIAPLLEGEDRAAMERLAAAWRERNEGIFERSVELVAAELARAATDHEPLPGALASPPQKRDAMAALARRLEERQQQLWDEVVAAHGLEGTVAGEVRRGLEHFVVTGEEALTPKKGALLGGAVSGALGGLTADLLAGGLSFGGGVLAGTILGVLGGAGLSHAMRLIRAGGEPGVSWSPGFLDELLETSVLRYLAIAHFGRGRGPIEEEAAESWRRDVREHLAPLRGRLAALWKEAEGGASARGGVARGLGKELAPDLRRLLN